MLTHEMNEDEYSRMQAYFEKRRLQKQADKDVEAQHYDLDEVMDEETDEGDWILDDFDLEDEG